MVQVASRQYLCCDVDSTWCPSHLAQCNGHFGKRAPSGSSYLGDHTIGDFFNGSRSSKSVI